MSGQYRNENTTPCSAFWENSLGFSCLAVVLRHQTTAKQLWLHLHQWSHASLYFEHMYPIIRMLGPRAAIPQIQHPKNVKFHWISGNRWAIMLNKTWSYIKLGILGTASMQKSIQVWPSKTSCHSSINSYVRTYHTCDNIRCLVYCNPKKVEEQFTTIW